MTDPSTGITRSLTVPLPPARGWARMRRWAVDTPFVQMLVLIVLVAILVALIPAFVARPQAAVAILVLASLLALAAMGQTLVVILGGMDLAVAGYILFGAMIASNATSRLGWPTWFALLVTVVVCGGIGALVGAACHRLHIQPLVFTLGVGAILAGGAMFLVNGDYNGQPPADLRSLAQLTGTTFGLPIPPIILIVVLLGIVLWLFLSRTATGRRLYATGVNPRAAALTRVNTAVIWTGVFALSGALAGIAGMFVAAFGSGWAQGTGDPYLFSGLAAVLVGGTTFGSVRGSFTRTALGALILTVVATIITSRGLAEAQSRIVYGIIILAVVALYGRERHVRDRF
ncbi:ABC transporter permease [Microbacterium trichothecenolyticum]|uniref:ABC transporter permease n=1 Tax=Microbacterium trichothecenolyticum TaxID=69370 RepID=UPI001C6E186D|nr:ABC transporter permease [Microbacterium trichothecenolyticum]MBW9120500.1 ABC transporter permease [Microbacterium trichothecenolyticum]